MPAIARNNFAKFFTGIEIIPVALAIGISVISPSMLLVAVITAAFFWTVRWIAERRFSIRTPGDGGVFLLIVMLPLTLWVSPLPEVTEPQVLRLLTGIALYYLIANWCNSQDRLRAILPGFALMGLGLALIAPISVRWAINKLPLIPASLYRAIPPRFSDFVHPNVLAGTLVLFLPIILAELLFAWDELTRPVRILILITLPTVLGVLGLTLSRGSWLALGAILIVLVMLRWRWGWVLLIPAGIAVFLLISWLGIGSILQVLASSGTIGGLDGRLEIWSRAIYMIRDFPFTGIGMGTFGPVADALYPFFLYAPESVPHAHNLFLQIAVDLGVPGLIGWLIVFLSVTIISWKLYQFGRENRDALASALGAGLFCSQLALTVHGMTDAVTWGMVRPAVFVWAIWGLAAASWAIWIKKPKVEETPISS